MRRLMFGAVLVLLAAGSLAAAERVVVLERQSVQGTVRSASAVIPAGTDYVRVIITAPQAPVWRLWLSRDSGRTWTVVQTETQGRLRRRFLLQPEDAGARLLVELDTVPQVVARVVLQWE